MVTPRLHNEGRQRRFTTTPSTDDGDRPPLPPQRPRVPTTHGWRSAPMIITTRMTGDRPPPSITGYARVKHRARFDSTHCVHYSHTSLMTNVSCRFHDDDAHAAKTRLRRCSSIITLHNNGNRPPPPQSNWSQRHPPVTHAPAPTHPSNSHASNPAAPPTEPMHQPPPNGAEHITAPLHSQSHRQPSCHVADRTWQPDGSSSLNSTAAKRTLRGAGTEPRCCRPLLMTTTMRP
ncbi:uncharacterized protein LACBIDRAFT_315465 [Laccaria bicolor S238N-H82]|uniref:Predicted protein n=1 Tax=Laccaria bicolor (strain S238N-H82 / ATCC MYA-4686) TaxID=486041 RepID=B0D2G5_LACBS|nr:uncharacterized protein LACBIDRAFT_315465 [Laccaria bicolor S238N-H82]EDR11096.1 predicted protein [Laccaria bicolor S238N-H82]|eukprot:XP_001878397.1 predicted protein [Laccaria bicolor S238N-H82]